MVTSIAKLLFTGVVPAVCDAEAGQEDAPEGECLVMVGAKRLQCNAASCAGSELALNGDRLVQYERRHED